jgi:hypothetical protein
MTSLTYEQVLHAKVAFGTAAGLIERLSQLREERGLDGCVAELNSAGQIPPERVKRSLQILTHEVMPACKWKATRLGLTTLCRRPSRTPRTYLRLWSHGEAVRTRGGSGRGRDR